jgi:aspartate 1-decarboxylase
MGDYPGPTSDSDQYDLSSYPYYDAKHRHGKTGKGWLLLSFSVSHLIEEREVLNFRPHLVYVDENNRITAVRHAIPT